MLFFYYDCIEGMILSRKKLRATLEWKIGKKKQEYKKNAKHNMGENTKSGKRYVQMHHMDMLPSTF